MSVLPQRAAVGVFLACAFAYFLSALLRAVTATLAPTLAQEFALHTADLGLLSGGYFLGFALMQLPLGHWLDRHGPRQVSLGFLGVAVLGCVLFAVATGFSALLAGRVLCGVGVSACLMAPLTGFRRWLTPAAQLRANAWMMMTGSLGMVASTLPVQWLVPLVGWRPLFWGLAALIALSMLWLAWGVPAWQHEGAAQALPGSAPASRGGYGAVWRHPYFQRLAPLGFFVYGGMVAMQTLWAGPWMQQVAGYSALASATGLFWINVSMLCAFWVWGMVSHRLQRWGLDTHRLMVWGLPASLLAMGALIALGERAGAGMWALYCVSSTFVALSLPALAHAFPAGQAGRALSAYNLVIFLGVFVVQWGIGLAVDGLVALGWTPVAAFRWAMGGYWLCSGGAYAWFRLRGHGHNCGHTAPP